MRAGFLLLALTCGAVLPPGYEDVLYCPDGACLRKNARLPPGWSGPRTQLYECVDPANDTVTRPKGWGRLCETRPPEGWRPASHCAEAPERTSPWSRLLIAPPYIRGAARAG